MPANLPPTLPSQRPSMPTSAGPGRAQNLSVSALQQKKDREAARVSVGQMRRESAEKKGERSTSVAHLGNAEKEARTSVSTGDHAKRSVYDDTYYSEEADESRYRYARRMIRERKKKEEAEAAAMSKKEAGKKGLYIGTGMSFTKKGASGFHKRLKHYFFKGKQKFKNLSKEDRTYFENLVGRYAGRKKTGSSFTFRDKKKMKLDVMRAWRGGRITKEDAKDFTGMIDSFEK